jgi:hypothetical protein
MPVPSKITTQQIRNFLNLNGIELKPSKKAPYSNMGLTFEKRLIRAAQDFNTFLIVDAKKKEEAVRFSHKADHTFFANPTEENRLAMLQANAYMRNALFA